MTWPLYQKGVFDYATAMALATVSGFLFGFVLERAGFGRARNLAAQFYGTDMRVLKVMFTAIVTATVGLGLLGAVGVVDLAAVQIPETYWTPQLVGGLILGVGFIVSGYCPGTAVVATASGNMDGVFSLLGVMLGAVVFAFGYPALESFYLSGHWGAPTLAGLLGVPWTTVAAGVAVMAVGAFLFAEWVERALARRAHRRGPISPLPIRRSVFAGLATTAALGVVATMVPLGPSRAAVAAPPAVVGISPLALAKRLVDPGASTWLVDLRARSACERKRIPGALCVAKDDPQAAFIAQLPATRTLVVYGADALPASVHAYAGPVFVLEGGYEGFKRDVLTAPEPPASAAHDAVAEYRATLALHGYFTGQKTPSAPVQVKVKAVHRKARKGGGC